jgi:hypothetical protein
MTNGFPMVIVLKDRRSEESRHGSLPSSPITPFFDTATTKAIRGRIELITLQPLSEIRHARILVPGLDPGINPPHLQGASWPCQALP